MSVFLIVLGTVLFINGMGLLVGANINTGVILVALLGVLFFIWGMYYHKIKTYTQKGVLKGLRIFVIILIFAEILFSGFIALYGQNDTTKYDEDVLIVLGGGIKDSKVSAPLKLRLDKAIEYHKKNPDAKIIVTGGKGPQETVTEAYAMEKYLIEKGVRKDLIIKEDMATSTKENMIYSKKILDNLYKDGYKVAFITNGFHIYRSVCYGKKAGLENMSHLHAELDFYNIIPCYIRESLATIKMWLIN